MLRKRIAHEQDDPSTQQLARREAALYRRFTRLAVILTLAAVAIYIVWSVASQNSSVEATALVEARAMNEQMSASWNYIDSIQDDVNHDNDGSYHFRGIYCAKAAKQIASQVTDSNTGYAVRYVRNNPRNVEDTPDDFETQALAAFSDTGQTEFYGIANYNGTETFRYISRLTIAENCLECHGTPAGSRDPTGGYREGKKLGDIAGATSIVIPLDGYRTQAMWHTVTILLLFGILLAALIITLRRTLMHWVILPMRDTNSQLAKANAAKSDFLTLISHELRTPLSSIIAFSDILDSESEPRTERDRHLIGEIRESGSVMLGMVNNLIDAAKIDGGRYELSVAPTDILDVIDIARSTVEPLALGAGIDLRLSYEKDIPLVMADAEATRKIITNLLGNAVKFTPPQGHIAIDVKSESDGRFVRVSVADDGRGIAPEDIDRIFERFEQGGTKTPAGSGLGLSISRDLAHMMGGTLTVESELDHGSTFTLRLPIAVAKDSQES